MSKNTLEFKMRVAERLMNSMGHGELNIKVVKITNYRKHFWEKYISRVTLQLGVTDSNTGELLVDIETITINAGDSLSIKDINNAFTVKFY